MANDTRNTHGQETGSGATAVDLTIFERYPPAQFTVSGQTFAFPVGRIQVTGGNRIIKRERPYRDGAKLDDTGSVAKTWTLEAVFENTLSEADAVNGGRPLYPDILNELLFIFDTSHETGDLIIPTEGLKRVRAETYQRTESFEERDCAVVQFTFVEDNEDSVDFKSITEVTASANARRLASTTTFDVQSIGSWHDSLDSLDAFTSSLEDIVNAPGEVAQDVESAALRIQGNAQRATNTFKRATKPGRDLFLDPANSRGERKIVRQREMAARAANEARNGRPQLLIVVLADDTTIFRVAALVGQDVVDLMSINPTLDPLYIPALTMVKVFATEDLLNGSRTTAA